MVVPTSESDSGAAVDNSRSILETEVVAQIRAAKRPYSERSFFRDSPYTTIACFVQWVTRHPIVPPQSDVMCKMDREIGTRPSMSNSQQVVFYVSRFLTTRRNTDGKWCSAVALL